MNRGFQQIYIRKELHIKVKALAAFSDIRVCDLASEIVKDSLEDREKMNGTIKRLRPK